jgi:hypothetical protein
MSLTGDLDDMSKDPGEVWEHKGELSCLSLSIESNLIFSDSSPTQCPSSLLLPSHPIGTITPSELTDTLNSQSMLSLSLHSISLYGAGSPSPSTASMTIPGTILWLLTSINPTGKKAMRRRTGSTSYARMWCSHGGRGYTSTSVSP